MIHTNILEITTNTKLLFKSSSPYYDLKTKETKVTTLSLLDLRMRP